MELLALLVLVVLAALLLGVLLLSNKPELRAARAMIGGPRVRADNLEKIVEDALRWHAEGRPDGDATLHEKAFEDHRETLALQLPFEKPKRLDHDGARNGSDYQKIAYFFHPERAPFVATDLLWHHSALPQRYVEEVKGEFEFGDFTSEEFQAQRSRVASILMDYRDYYQRLYREWEHPGAGGDLPPEFAQHLRGVDTAAKMDSAIRDWLKNKRQELAGEGRTPEEIEDLMRNAEVNAQSAKRKMLREKGLV